ncbi:hypothetical protein F4556_004017 [Kitasatospora gansuensis]|uniref:Uncharacterized protein n=1 Tax=Kitasatospora gansuensis TaxID=258050 RepID=A0A7W7SDV7_9ACTN|nr:hypothetical protein [Kitasatospora gansuensis]MBB4948482.1 hypothetical protein [Kitasatospora gansuensis]
MTVPSSRTGLRPVPLTALLDSDRVEVRRPVGLASLARLDRLGRPSGPVVARGDRVAFLLAPDTAEAVPELLHWLGWGAELRLGLTARAAEPARVPRPRGAEEAPPRPDDRSAVWLRPAGTGTGLDLRSPDLLRLLDCLADACARDLMGLAPAR